MRSVSPAFQTKLDGGVTTACRCWIVTRRDGVVLGFTDHDADVLFNTVLCRADAGLSASEATARLGLSVDASEIAGALAGDTLSESDLAAGRFDAAEIDVHLVDWTDPALSVQLAKGVLGEVRREGHAFQAELRGLGHRLAEEKGRLYTPRCNADLGDTRCTVDLTQPALRGTGIVSAADSASVFRADGLDDFEDGWFTSGKLIFTSGANNATGVEVKVHRKSAGGVTVQLWQSMPEAIAISDAFTVTAGCDKRFATCRSKFANALNFRGFPHLPGNDFVVAYPAAGEPGNDGGRLSR